MVTLLIDAFKCRCNCEFIFCIDNVISPRNVRLNTFLILFLSVPYKSKLQSSSVPMQKSVPIDMANPAFLSVVMQFSLRPRLAFKVTPHFLFCLKHCFFSEPTKNKPAISNTRPAK